MKTIIEQNWELDPQLPYHCSFAADCIPEDYAFRVEFSKSRQSGNWLLTADQKIAVSILIASAPKMLAALRIAEAALYRLEGNMAAHQEVQFAISMATDDEANSSKGDE